ncbi:MAG: CHAT domain-containing tetratricopeptide repeat protein [Planctomycetota bacterium]
MAHLFDVAIAVRDESGRIVASGDNDWLGQHARVVYELTADSTYQVEVRSVDGNAGSYQLRWTLGPAAKLSRPEQFELAAVDARRTVVAREKLLAADDLRLADALHRLGYYSFVTRDYAVAEQAWRRALEIREKKLSPDDLELAKSLNNYGLVHRHHKRFREAASLFERSLAIREKSLEPNDKAITQSLKNLAGVYESMQSFSQAQPLFGRLVAIFDRSKGPDHKDTINALRALGRMQMTQHLHREALPTYRRLLAHDRKRLGKHPHVVQAMNNVAAICGYLQMDTEARAVLEEALAMCEEVCDPNNWLVGDTLNNLGARILAMGEPDVAIKYFQRALIVLETFYGQNHDKVAGASNNLATAFLDVRSWEDARGALRRAIAITEKLHGADHSEVATPLHNLGTLEQSLGNYATARGLLERALSIRRKALHANHPFLERNLIVLAELQTAQGNYDQALPFLDEAIAIAERTSGSHHPNVARRLQTKVSILNHLNRHSEALAAARRGVAIVESAPDPSPNTIIAARASLAEALFVQGKLDEALAAYRRLLIQRERGNEDLQFATLLSNYAGVLMSQGEFAAARKHFVRSLAIGEKIDGPRSLSVADTLVSLGHLADAERRHSDALALQQRALQIREQALGSAAPDVARVLLDLAKTERRLGRLKLSRSHAQRAESIWSAAFGPEHERTLWAMKLQLSLDQDEKADGAVKRARILWRRQKQRLLSHLADASESDALRYAAELERSVFRLHSTLGTESTERTEECYAAVTTWKGLVSRFFQQSRQRVFAALSSQQRIDLVRLRELQSALSNALSEENIPDPQLHARKIRQLRQDRDTLGARLRQSSGLAALATAALSPREIAAALPDESAWVDFFESREYVPGVFKDGKLVAGMSWSEPQLSAWIITKAEGLTCVDLGDSARIQQAAQRVLAAITRQRGAPSRGLDLEPSATGERAKAAVELHTLLWQPLAGHVGDAQRLFVCPDSFLATLPFEVLHDGDGRYLIERHGFVYLQDSASLLRLGARRERREPTLLAAGAIDYTSREASDSAGEPNPPQNESTVMRGGDLRRAWQPLPNTRPEVDGINAAHRRRHAKGLRKTLHGRGATEERLKDQLPKYSVVHLATHGYFQPEALPSAWAVAREQNPGVAGGRRDSLAFEHQLATGYLPGLLSGLVCAGASGKRDAGQDNGLLTAEEVAWLDLGQCDLVVLSACETAVGTVRAGEGMMSLRRAFRQAGARAVVSSLWKVQDDATRELMLDFYDGLWRRNLGTLEALRAAQLRMLQKNRARGGKALPETWGAFVLSGDWR